MKAIIEKKKLMQALTHLHGVVEKRNTIPILANVLMEAKDNFLSLSATDMEIAELQKVSCEIEQNGVITTPAHVLHDIVRKLPDGSEVKIELIELNVEVSAGKSKFILPTLPVDDYPIMTNIEKDYEFNVQSIDFANLIIISSVTF